MHLLLSFSFTVTATLAFHHIKLKHFNVANIRSGRCFQVVKMSFLFCP